MSIYKKLLSHTAVYGISTIIQRLLNFLLIPLYTKVFIPEQYGKLSLIYAFIAILQIILTYGLETGFFRFISSKKYPPQSLYGSLLVSISSTSFIFLAFYFFTYKKLAVFLDYSNFSNLFLYAGFIVFFDVLCAIPFAKLRYKGKAIKFSSIKLINVFITLILNFIFLIFLPRIGYTNILGFDSLVEYAFFSNLMASFIQFLFIIPEIFREKLLFDWKIIKDAVPYSFPLMISGLAGTLNELLDRFLIEKLILDRANALALVGIFGANAKLIVILKMFVQAFRIGAEPIFFQKSLDHDSKKVYSYIMKYFIIFGAVIILFVMFNLSWIKYLIDSKYWNGLEVVPLLLISTLFIGILYNLSVWYKMINKTHYAIWIMTFGVIITIAINIVLIPKIGYMGAAIAQLVSSGAMVLFSFYLGRKYYKIPYNFKDIFLTMILAVIFYSIYLGLPINQLYFKIFIGNILILIYITILFILNKKELKGLMR